MQKKYNLITGIDSTSMVFDGDNKNKIQAFLSPRVEQFGCVNSVNKTCMY